MVDEAVRRRVETTKSEWTRFLVKHGYNIIEEDLTDDCGWHSGLKPLGRVAFWRRKEDDGIVISRVKFYDEGGATLCGVWAHAVGAAYRNFNELGYECMGRESEITVNGRTYKSIVLDSSSDFRNFLYRTKPKKE